MLVERLLRYLTNLSFSCVYEDIKFKITVYLICSFLVFNEVCVINKMYYGFVEYFCIMMCGCNILSVSQIITVRYFIVNNITLKFSNEL